jgi:hypothetical protein
MRMLILCAMRLVIVSQNSRNFSGSSLLIKPNVSMRHVLLLFSLVFWRHVNFTARNNAAESTQIANDATFQSTQPAVVYAPTKDLTVLPPPQLELGGM